MFQLRWVTLDLRVKTNNIDGYIDVKCYYSPHFTSTLLSENDVLQATGHPEEYKGTEFWKFLAPNEEKLQKDMNSGKVDVENIDYKSDYGTCLLICVHRKKYSRNVIIPGIIRNGLCFTQPLLPPNLLASHPKATIYNSSEKLRQECLEFDSKCKQKALKNDL